MIAAIKLKVASDAQINEQVGVTITFAPKMCMQMLLSEVTQQQGQISCIPV